jgi:hypothetical protein
MLFHAHSVSRFRKTFSSQFSVTSNPALEHFERLAVRINSADKLKMGRMFPHLKKTPSVSPMRLSRKGEVRSRVSVESPPSRKSYPQKCGSVRFGDDPFGTPKPSLGWQDEYIAALAAGDL